MSSGDHCLLILCHPVDKLAWILTRLRCPVVGQLLVTGCGGRLRICQRHGISMTLTCVEMCDGQHPPAALCGPEGLLRQVCSNASTPFPPHGCFSHVILCPTWLALSCSESIDHSSHRLLRQWASINRSALETLEWVSFQVREGASAWGVVLGGENALPCFTPNGVDATALDRIVYNTQASSVLVTRQSDLCRPTMTLRVASAILCSAADEHNEHALLVSPAATAVCSRSHEAIAPALFR